MLSKFIEIVNKRRRDITFVIIVFLLLMLSFSTGYTVAKYQPSQPIEFVNNQGK